MSNLMSNQKSDLMQSYSLISLEETKSQLNVIQSSQSLKNRFHKVKQNLQSLNQFQKIAEVDNEEIDYEEVSITKPQTSIFSYLYGLKLDCKQMPRFMKSYFSASNHLKSKQFEDEEAIWQVGILSQSIKNKKNRQDQKIKFNSDVFVLSFNIESSPSKIFEGLVRQKGLKHFQWVNQQAYKQQQRDQGYN